MTKPISYEDVQDLIQPSQTSAPFDVSAAQNLMQQAPQQQQGLSWQDVPLTALKNVVPSAMKFGEGIAHAVTNPLETATNVMDLMAGGLHNITPKHIASFIDAADAHPEAIDRAVNAANAVGKFYKDRYGSSQGFKDALANDPVGVASDLSAALSGGASLAGKVGLPGVSAGLKTASQYTNPIGLTVEAGKKIAPATLGLTTGTGSENISRAAQAGAQGDTGFLQNLRGQVPMTQALEDARHNLSVMRQNRSQSYKSGMVDVSNDKTRLNFDDIDKALADAKAEITYKGQIKNPEAYKHLQDIQNTIKQWKVLPSAEYHSAEGLDALKQQIGALNESIPYTQENALRVGNNIYNSVKGTIAKQAPTYSNVMSDYSEASESIKEIERALSLGNRASADTALRKLQSLTRNNVNTNYGNRLSLAQQLEEEGGKPFINALSGQALSSPTARGLAGLAEQGAMVGAYANPAFLFSLPFQTPRLVGEGAYLTGKIANKAQKYGVTPQSGTALSSMLNATRSEQK
jgi:hypothetical protein